MTTPEKHILLTIDVEDWFQVENLKPCIPFASWPSRELRVEKNTHQLLDILDAIPFVPATELTTQAVQKPRATFFVLGWVAEHLPGLVREIQARGHEVASHGHLHKLCNHSTPKELREDLSTSKQILEDILGIPIHGYRAPGFSVSEDVLRMAEEVGYRYDSSYNSFGGNSRYGRLNLHGYPRKGIARKISKGLYELPVSNVELGGYALPFGGGGYFRLFPVHIFMLGVRTILKREHTYLFYLHPWELDSEQPRAEGLPHSFRLRHYVNLQKTASRLSKLTETFSDCGFLSCSQYLESQRHAIPPANSASSHES